jgi:hypothetical protein
MAATADERMRMWSVYLQAKKADCPGMESEIPVGDKTSQYLPYLRGMCDYGKKTVHVTEMEVGYIKENKLCRTTGWQWVEETKYRSLSRTQFEDNTLKYNS